MRPALSRVDLFIVTLGITLRDAEACHCVHCFSFLFSFLFLFLFPFLHALFSSSSSSHCHTDAADPLSVQWLPEDPIHDPVNPQEVIRLGKTGENLWDRMTHLEAFRDVDSFNKVTREMQTTGEPPLCCGPPYSRPHTRAQTAGILSRAVRAFQDLNGPFVWGCMPWRRNAGRESHGRGICRVATLVQQGHESVWDRTCRVGWEPRRGCDSSFRRAVSLLFSEASLLAHGLSDLGG
jgi:hypothetical protein